MIVMRLVTFEQWANDRTVQACRAKHRKEGGCRRCRWFAGCVMDVAMDHDAAAAARVLGAEKAPPRIRRQEGN